MSDAPRFLKLPIDSPPLNLLPMHTNRVPDMITKMKVFNYKGVDLADFSFKPEVNFVKSKATGQSFATVFTVLTIWAGIESDSDELTSLYKLVLGDNIKIYLEFYLESVKYSMMIELGREGIVSESIISSDGVVPLDTKCKYKSRIPKFIRKYIASIQSVYCIDPDNESPGLNEEELQATLETCYKLSLYVANYSEKLSAGLNAVTNLNFTAASISHNTLELSYNMDGEEELTVSEDYIPIELLNVVNIVNAFITQKYEGGVVVLSKLSNLPKNVLMRVIRTYDTHGTDSIFFLDGQHTDVGGYDTDNYLSI